MFEATDLNLRNRRTQGLFRLLFLLMTVVLIVPVVMIDGRQIGDGKPGSTTMKLLDAFRELRVKDGYKVSYDTEAVQ